MEKRVIRGKTLIVDTDSLSTDQLTATLEDIAKTSEVADGHLTIMRFTTGWKAVLGSAPLWDFDSCNKFKLSHRQTHPTLRDAVIDLLRRIDSNGILPNYMGA